MKAEGFCRSAPHLFQSSSSGNAPRKIWEAHAKIRFTILMKICDVIHQSSQPNARLLFDASQRANRYISNRMWHSDPSRLHWMLELLVAPNMSNLIPAVLFQALYDFWESWRLAFPIRMYKRKLRKKWRRGRESNPRVAALQAAALPLGHRALPHWVYPNLYPKLYPNYPSNA